ncbi:hypothetical protein CRUP_000421 [Coryphaenoides rupestris]|nr:hypothetical protein CRUP_000421 [Coryphaenoides rupestris]
MPSPPTRRKNPVFENEDMGKLLAELLRSKNPEDLQEANRLIKSMVKEDDARVQKVTKRIHTLEEVAVNELYERCDKLRRATFKMATETEDNDMSLGEILQASDDLSRVINSYRKVVEGQRVNGETEDIRPPAGSRPEGRTDTPSPPGPAPPSPPAATPPPPPPPVAATYPDLPSSGGHMAFPIPALPPPPQRLGGAAHGSHGNSPGHVAAVAVGTVGGGLNDPVTSQSGPAPHALSGGVAPWSCLQAPEASVDLFGSIAQHNPVLVPTGPPTHTTTHPTHTSTHPTHTLQDLQDLAMLGFGDNKSLAGQTLGIGFGIPTQVSNSSSTSSSSMAQVVVLPGSPAVCQARAQSLGSAPGSPLFHSMSPSPAHGHALPASPSRGPEVSLAGIHVPQEAIRPSKVLPVTAYDKDGVRVLLNFAADCPPGRPDVLVMVVSMLNTAPSAVQNVVLQAAVPKSMKLKLQPPSGTELAAFNPILPPASITQIMLLANPAKEKVRLRYKLGFTLGERPCNEAGEVDQFPRTETWGHL